MTIKQKILDALDCALDDLDEDRLLQILLDAYASKKLTIASLERERSELVQKLHDEREYGRADRGRMVSGPQGEYFFRHPNLADPRMEQRFVVNVRANRMEMYERKPGYDVAIMQVTREDFLK